jgi:hypothetical protein
MEANIIDREKKKSRNDMKSQATPRGCHPGPQRGKVLNAKPELGVPLSF